MHSFNTMRIAAAATLAAFAVSAALAQDVGVLHLRPLHLELPATWSFDGSKRPIEGRGPDGEKILISILRLRPKAPSEPLPSARDTAQGFVQERMGELASKGGKTVVRPVSEIPVPEGKAGYSVASEASGVIGGKSYFIQYLLAAPGVIIYVTLEGKGEAMPPMERFDAFLRTQRWDE